MAYKFATNRRTYVVREADGRYINLNGYPTSDVAEIAAFPTASRAGLVRELFGGRGARIVPVLIGASLKPVL